MGDYLKYIAQSRSELEEDNSRKKRKKESSRTDILFARKRNA